MGLFRIVLRSQAGIGYFVGVLQMAFHVLVLVCGFAAQVAHKWILAGVNTIVDGQRSRVRESLVAFRALEGFFAGVNSPNVGIHARQRTKLGAAMLALERSSVQKDVPGQ